MIQLPDQWIQNIEHVHKEEGKRWLKRLPERIRECEKRWQLKVMDPFELSYNFVAPAKGTDGNEYVLKLGFPDEDFKTSVKALSLFKGNGMVQVIDGDPNEGMILMERITPGTPLALLEDDMEATQIAADLMRRLWKPASKTCDLPTTKKREKSLADLYRNYPDGIGPINGQTLEEALNVFKSMNQIMENPYLLHGDLHHYNMLKAGEEQWIAIDPKGLIGDREYDVIQFLLNQLPENHKTLTIRKRIEIFSERLNLDSQKIALWGFAHSVLATAWTVQENGNYNETFFKTIDVFKHIMSCK